MIADNWPLKQCVNVILLQFYLHLKAIVTLLYITIQQGKMSIVCVVILVILLFEINKNDAKRTENSYC